MTNMVKSAKQPMREMPKQRDGESDEDFDLRMMAYVFGDDIRSKTDLKDWTGSFPFHLDKSP